MIAYPGLASKAFRHPLDREAEQALRSVPGFDLVTGKFIEFLYERPQLNPACLELEITERLLMGDVPEAGDVLHQLSHLGFCSP